MGAIADKNTESKCTIHNIKNLGSSYHMKTAVNFLKRFYNDSTKEESRLDLYYEKSSSACYSLEEQMSRLLSDIPAQLQEKRKKEGFIGGRIEIFSIDATSGVKGSISVLVVASLTNETCSIINKRFIQSFTLAPRLYEDGYFVLNDMCRFLGEDSKIEQAVPEKMQEKEKIVEESKDIPKNEKKASYKKRSLKGLYITITECNRADLEEELNRHGKISYLKHFDKSLVVTFEDEEITEKILADGEIQINDLKVPVQEKRSPYKKWNRKYSPRE